MTTVRLSSVLLSTSGIVVGNSEGTGTAGGTPTFAGSANGSSAGSGSATGAVSFSYAVTGSSTGSGTASGSPAFVGHAYGSSEGTGVVAPYVPQRDLVFHAALGPQPLYVVTIGNRRYSATMGVQP